MYIVLQLFGQKYVWTNYTGEILFQMYNQIRFVDCSQGRVGIWFCLHERGRTGVNFKSHFPLPRNTCNFLLNQRVPYIKSYTLYLVPRGQKVITDEFHHNKSRPWVPSAYKTISLERFKSQIDLKKNHGHLAKHINVALTDTSADGREAFRVHIKTQLGLKVLHCL